MLKMLLLATFIVLKAVLDANLLLDKGGIMSRIIRDDLEKFFAFNISIPDKTLYMGETDGTEHHMAEKAIKGLHVLDFKNRRKKITILMNNPGGDEYHGLAIYDAIKACKSETVIKVFGYAMSMGAWILQAADKRYLHANSTVMMHYGTWKCEGHSLDAKGSSKENDRLNTLMEDHFLDRIREKHPRYTRRALQDLIRFDRYLTASQALELGFADKII